MGQPSELYRRVFGPSGEVRPEGRRLGEAVYDAAAEAVRTGRSVVVAPPLVGLIQKTALEGVVAMLGSRHADLNAIEGMAGQITPDVPASTGPTPPPRAVPRRETAPVGAVRETAPAGAGCAILQDTTASGRLLASDYLRWRELSNRCNAGR